jgi:hypothetical protein
VALTTQDLNRATLARQLLLGREPLPGPQGVADGIRRVVALQAQHPASPYLALWNRIADLDPTDVDEAYASRAIVRSTLLRITLHTVHAADHPGFRVAMQPTLRAARLNDTRFRVSGLDAAGADALVPGLLAYLDQPRTGVELAAWIDDRHADAGRPAWWALRHYGPFVYAPSGRPWSFGRTASWLPAPGFDGEGEDAVPTDPEEALVPLVHRYLAGFGPASAVDVAQFMLVNRPRARAALAALGDELEVLDGPDGTPLYDVPGAPRPPSDTPAPPRLLGMWDNVLLAHADRSRVLPAEYRPHVSRRNGDVLPTLLVDGFVAGVWRTVPGADGGPVVEAHAFRPLPDDVWSALAGEAAALVTMLAEREAHPYARYDGWWAKLPEPAQVRRLPG